MTNKTMREIDSLKFDPANSRKHDERNIKSIMDSLKMHGQRKPIVIYSDMIVAGNGTVEAAKRLGWSEIWVNNDSFESIEHAKAYAVQDNRTAELAAWDDEQLGDTLTELKDKGWDLDTIGFNDDELSKLMKEEKGTDGLTDADDIPETEQNEFGVKRGDIWQLGNHRVMCGDSTDQATVEKLMNGEKADMVFTDPPYRITNVDQKTHNNPDLTKFHDVSQSIKHIGSFEPNDFLKVVGSVFEKNKINVYIFCNKDLILDYLLWGKSQGSPPNLLVWKKPLGMVAHRQFQYDVEYICYFRLNAIWNNKIDCANYSKVQEYGRPSKSEKGDFNDHPTIKPIELLSNILSISSNKNSLVVDFFLGSGSTLIACEKTGRKCYGMELDEHYCSVIIKRWEDFTGKKAERIIEGA